MAKIIENIGRMVEKEGITIGALERQIGASKGVLSRALQNGTDIQAKWLSAIVENYPHISTDWLLTGEGSMVKGDMPIVSGSSDLSDKLLAIIQEKDAIIREQAEEIGRLRERLESRGDDASSATDLAPARVG